ncbi:hypothetical protein GGQ85_002218 [Nitrobacter vulgaris]|nr:hypothetical protein [Nitrobacter vulgaris]MDR6304508.1 hypothetical protein [Nitrobacter vulgaris]
MTRLLRRPDSGLDESTLSQKICLAIAAGGSFALIVLLFYLFGSVD